jgi:aspartyl/glutamyl-tRNA(Asn/Gln) amidotransferase C subunit
MSPTSRGSAFRRRKSRRSRSSLGDVLGYVSQLKEVDVSHVSLLGEADLKNRLRADEVRPSLPPPRRWPTLPKQDNNLFVVPKIIE